MCLVDSFDKEPMVPVGWPLADDNGAKDATGIRDFRKWGAHRLRCHLSGWHWRLECNKYESNGPVCRKVLQTVPCHWPHGRRRAGSRSKELGCTRGVFRKNGQQGGSTIARTIGRYRYLSCRVAEPSISTSSVRVSSLVLAIRVVIRRSRVRSFTRSGILVSSMAPTAQRLSASQ